MTKLVTRIDPDGKSLALIIDDCVTKIKTDPINQESIIHYSAMAANMPKEDFKFLVKQKQGDG
jgi:hypothetical protein